jgi:mediator of RNA polymerase II transcription subunit 21
MYATLSYTSTRAAPSPIPGQPLQSPAAPAFPSSTHATSDAAAPETQTQTQTQGSSNPTQTTTSFDPSQPQTQTQTQPQTQTRLLSTRPPRHDPAAAFTADLHELARDLIVKEQQIEMLIERLPGIGTSERAQRARMAVLERQLREIEEERARAVAEKERLLERVAGRIAGVRGL